MKILVFGDLFWRIWRKALLKEIWGLRKKYKPDFVIVNGENMTSWRGPIEKHMKLLHDIWVDLFTAGDHVFDNEKNLRPYLEREDCKLIRPANYYESEFYTLLWDWFRVLKNNWKRLLVINLLSETFTRDHVYNPFLKAHEIVKEFEKKGKKLNGIIIDFHKEVSSEWYAMQEFLDGRVSFIYGTHTHIQTNDENISEWGTWLLSDVWMVWAKKSIIGSDYGSLRKRFLTGLNKGKIDQSLDSNYIMNGAFIKIDSSNMKCLSIKKIRIEWNINK